VLAALSSVASVAFAALYSRTGKVTAVKTCLDGTTPYCLFQHSGDSPYWFATGAIVGSSADVELAKQSCSLATAALLSGRTVTTKHTSYTTICGEAYTRRLWTGDSGTGIMVHE
jgi:hypothetical protein